MTFTILVVDTVEIVTIDGPRAALWGRRRNDAHFYFGCNSFDKRLVGEKKDVAMFLQLTSIYHKWQICNLREIKNCSSSMQVNLPVSSNTFCLNFYLKNFQPNFKLILISRHINQKI